LRKGKEKSALVKEYCGFEERGGVVCAGGLERESKTKGEDELVHWET
jgi:hypothetical protein